MKGIRISSLIEISSDPARPNADNPHVKILLLPRSETRREREAVLPRNNPSGGIHTAGSPNHFRILESFGYVVNPLNHLLG